MESSIRIVSDGTPSGTRVYNKTGELTDIAKIEVLPVTPYTEVRARLTFRNVKLDLCNIEQLEAWDNDGTEY